MEREMLSGKIEEVIYARVRPGEDLLRALWDICAKKGVKTGVLLDATGALESLRVMKIAHEIRKDNFGCEYIDVPGYSEVTAHGIIGVGWVPDKSIAPPASVIRGYHDTGFGSTGFVAHDTPYIHIHITASSASETICGHLLEGSKVCSRSKGGTGYFTVVIAKVSGVLLRTHWPTAEGGDVFQELLPA